MPKRYLVYLRRFYRLYKSDTTFEEAAGLSFYTIFAIVPTLSVALSIVVHIEKFAPFLHRLNEFLISNFLPINQETISKYLNDFLDNSAQIGIMGVAFVIFSSVMFFMSYEYIINKIYKTKIKSYFLSIAVYIVLTIAFPIVLMLSFYVSDEFTIILQRHTFIKHISIARILPFVFFWLIFYTSYKITPNKPVKTKAAFISSVISVFIWIVAKNLFFYYAFYNKNYVSLYGQLSILILFMLWIYVSWIIFIYGLKFCKFLDED